jgi:hypothetical protein
MRVFPLIVCSVSVLVAQDFVKDVQPILRKKCAGCHGAAMQSNGLRLDDGAAVIKGGYSGPAIVKGKSAESKLIERVTSSKAGFQMPPAGPRLTEDGGCGTARLDRWGRGGAGGRRECGSGEDGLVVISTCEARGGEEWYRCVYPCPAPG